ncbi:MAG: acyltransferase [Deltaproteobacteria bacterium]|nr:MAG: acyltransferase [Deltaproteobacteria bacterium]
MTLPPPFGYKKPIGEMKVAAIQMASSTDKGANLAKALRLGKVAVDRGAEILCYPELFPTYWFPAEIDERAFELAEGLDGPVISEMKAFCKREGVGAVVPFFERCGEKFHNSAAVISRDGELLGVYRKVHVPQLPLWEERSYFTPGEDFPVFDIDGVKIGVQICWDNFFPEGARILALKGAELLFAPTAAAFMSQQRWLKVLAGHALCNGLFVLRVNRVGSEAHQDFYGMSFCLSPEGELLTEPAGLEEGVLLAEVSPDEAGRARREWPFFRDRRPETYGEILK